VVAGAREELTRVVEALSGLVPDPRAGSDDEDDNYF